MLHSNFKGCAAFAVIAANSMLTTLINAESTLKDKVKSIRLGRYSGFKLEGNITNYQTKLRQQDYTSKVESGGSFQIFNSVVSSSSTAGYSTE